MKFLYITLIFQPKRLIFPLKRLRQMSDVLLFLSEVALKSFDVEIFLLELLLQVHELELELSILVSVL